MTTPELSVVILSWNTKDLTLACLNALERDDALKVEVIVVDNGSHDGSADAIAEAFPEVVLVRNEENQGYSKGNNQGAAVARGDYLCLLNSDTEVRPGALALMLSFLRDHPGYGAVAPKLVHPDGRAQPSCKRFPGLLTALCFDTFWGSFPPGSLIERRYLMRDFDHLSSRDVDQPPGACMMMRREEFGSLGGLDPELWLFFNDVDLCRQLWRRGRRIRYLAEAEVVHHEGASTKSFDGFVVLWHRNRMAYFRKHYGVWAAPYMRFLVRLRGWEEWFRIGYRQRDRQARRSERRHLRQVVREVLAS